jgi:hypothetical protein
VRAELSCDGITVGHNTINLLMRLPSLTGTG